MFGISLSSVWLHIAAGSITTALGIAYLFQAGPVVKEFKLILLTHRRILSMALVSQGLAYCFIGALTIANAAAAPNAPGGSLVSWVCTGMLLVFSLWTGSTGARSENILFRVSHFVTIVAAAFLLLGNAPGR